MPLALLLSPDDQAVSAITAVLEEMSVTCERPLDGVSAAQKLNSSSFDLVLVDCENLPAAKLIFDVCRRGKNGNNPVPIAIVDGRAGLPTAFRLGAELILTKPVAKDQARSTIRTAVSRVKKEEPVRAATSDEQSKESNVPVSVELVSPLDHVEVAHPESQDEHALAATAAVASSPLTSYSEPIPVMALPASAPAMKMPATEVKVAAPEETPLVAELKEPMEEELSEDPVLAELDRVESEPQAKAVAPVFSAYPEKSKKGQSKSRGPLAAVFVLLLAGAGFYAAWMYQPGFRALVQPQIDRVLGLIGMPRQAQSTAPTPIPIRAVTPPAPATPNLPEPSQAATTPATDGSAVVTTSDTAAKPPAQPTSVPGTPVGVDPAGKGVSKAEVDKPVVVPNVTKRTVDSSTTTTGKSSAPAGAVDAELPGEKTAIILSSKGAEKRLAHSVQPKYPAGAHLTGSEGTMVLKAVIDENGKVEGARVVEGNTDLANVAISAVKQWRYRPYMRDGKALPFQTIVLVDFQRQ